MELEFSGVHFIYGLIFQRLGHGFKIKCDQGALLYMRWEDLKREMITVEIKLSEGTYEDFKYSLTKSEIYLSYPDNKVHIPMLIAVSEEYVDHVAHLTEQINDKYECPISSTVARMLREARPKWENVREVLVVQQERMRRYCGDDSASKIKEDDFMNVLRRTGGVIVTSEDAKHFWEYLVQCSTADSHSQRGRDTCLTIQELHKCLGPREQTYSSLANLMRENYTYHHKSNLGGGKVQDHIVEIFNSKPQVDENNSSVSNIQQSRLSHFPWQKDESDPVSNLKLRALQGLQNCNQETQAKFVQELHSKENSFNFSVARGVLHEAFSMAGIHFHPHDMEALWLEMQSTLRTLQASDIVHWLQLGHIPYQPSSSDVGKKHTYPYSAGRLDPAKPTGVLDPVHSSLNPRHTQPQSSWDYCSNKQESPRTSKLSTYRSENSKEIIEPDSESSPIDDTPPIKVGQNSNDATAAYKAAINGLLHQRPQLAHAFRRISIGSGLGKGEDVCETLQMPPFNVPLSHDETWDLVCHAAGVDRNTLPARVYLRFNDLISYLEDESKVYLQPKIDKRRASIQLKLRQCSKIRGNAQQMIEQFALLRTRLRHIRQRGTVTSWDAVPDICYPQEFVHLMESIGLCFTQEEIIYIYKSLNHEDGPMNTPAFFNQCKYGMPLGASISFLSSLCNE